MYDNISREDILAHAYAQCRSNKGASGADGQDFADINHGADEKARRRALRRSRRERYRPPLGLSGCGNSLLRHAIPGIAKRCTHTM
jgi:hypothetical protein